MNELVETFSGFGNPDLKNCLLENDIKRVFTCGLAYDFCVGYTSVDAAKLGFEVFCIKDASRGIGEEFTKYMENLFEQNKIKIITSEQISHYL